VATPVVRIYGGDRALGYCADCSRLSMKGRLATGGDATLVSARPGLESGVWY
jgi:hypothetical protein